MEFTKSDLLIRYVFGKTTKTENKAVKKEIKRDEITNTRLIGIQAAVNKHNFTSQEEYQRWLDQRTQELKISIHKSIGHGRPYMVVKKSSKSK